MVVRRSISIKTRNEPIQVCWNSRSGISLLSSINMAGGDSIKLFQFIRKFCQTIRIVPPDQNQYSINRMNLFNLFCLNQFLISTVAFVLFQANSMAEYGVTFFIGSGIVAFDVYCLVVFCQFGDISKIVGNWEEFIQKSEFPNFNNFKKERKINIFIFFPTNVLCVTGVHSTILYRAVTEKIDRFNEFLGYCLLTTLFSLMAPVLIYTIINYYVFDSKEASFLLYMPGWFVLIKLS